MKNKYLAIILVALITGNLFGQNTTARRFSQIDSLISLIPSNGRDNDYFSDIQSSGLIHKRILGIFRKQIGSVSSETIFSDTLVYSSSNYYRYKKDSKIIIEDFYYQNNHLIRYNRELSVKRKTDENRNILHKIVAYFDNQNLIGLSDTINDGYIFNKSEQIKVISKADIVVCTTLETLKVMNPKSTTTLNTNSNK